MTTDDRNSQGGHLVREVNVTPAEVRQTWGPRRSNPLTQVITLSEAIRIYQTHRQKLLWLYWRGSIRMVRSGWTWLVDYNTLYRLWGPPLEPPDWFTEFYSTKQEPARDTA